MARTNAIHSAAGALGVSYSVVPHEPRHEGEPPDEFAVMKSRTIGRGEAYHPIARGLSRAHAIIHCDRLAASARELAANLARAQARQTTSNDDAPIVVERPGEVPI